MREEGWGWGEGGGGDQLIMSNILYTTYTTHIWSERNDDIYISS